MDTAVCFLLIPKMKLVIEIIRWGGGSDFFRAPFLENWFPHPTYSIKTIRNPSENQLNFAYHTKKSLRKEKNVKNLQNEYTLSSQNSLNWEGFSNFSLFWEGFRHQTQNVISSKQHSGPIRLGMWYLRITFVKTAQARRSLPPPSAMFLNNQLHMVWGRLEGDFPWSRPDLAKPGGGCSGAFHPATSDGRRHSSLSGIFNSEFCVRPRRPTQIG